MDAEEPSKTRERTNSEWHNRNNTGKKLSNMATQRGKIENSFTIGGTQAPTGARSKIYTHPKRLESSRMDIRSGHYSEQNHEPHMVQWQKINPHWQYKRNVPKNQETTHYNMDVQNISAEGMRDYTHPQSPQRPIQHYASEHPPQFVIRWTQHNKGPQESNELNNQTGRQGVRHRTLGETIIY